MLEPAAQIFHMIRGSIYETSFDKMFVVVVMGKDEEHFIERLTIVSDAWLS